MPLDVAKALAEVARPEPADVRPSDTCEHGAGPDELCMLCPEEVALHRLFEGGLERSDDLSDELLRKTASDLRRRFACDFTSVVERVLAAEDTPAIRRALLDGLWRAYRRLCDAAGRPAYEFREEFEACWKASPPPGKPAAATKADIRCVVVKLGDHYGWQQVQIITVAANHARHAAKIAVEAARAIGCEIHKLYAVAGDKRPGGAR